MEFVYVQVNGTQEYVQDSLNTTTVVVLEVLFPYEIIYEMGPPMLEKQVKESQSRVAPPLFAQVGVGGVTQRHPSPHLVGVVLLKNMPIYVPSRPSKVYNEC